MALVRVTVLSLLALAVPALAEDAAAPQQCWTSEVLAGTPGEIQHQRSKGPLDVAVLKATPLPPVTPVEPARRGLIESVTLPPDKKLIAFTFDLCEESGYVSGYDGRIVDLLRKEGTKATFFAGGKWMETHPERAEQLIADPLFEVGSHGLKHVDLSRASDAVIKDEVTLTEAAYARAKARLSERQCLVGKAVPSPPERLTVFRFPYGRCNAKALAAVDNAGLLPIQWDVVTGDPDPHRSAKAIANTILTRAHPGAIIVGHANGRGRNTAAALAIALPKLKEEGYSFVTVSELIAAGKLVIAQRCSGPGLGNRIARTSRRQTTNDLFSFFYGHN